MNKDEKEAPKSFIVIEFEDVGSARFKMSAQGVTATQILLAGDYIQLKAKDQILAQEHASKEQQEQMKIQVPTGQIVTERR